MSPQWVLLKSLFRRIDIKTITLAHVDSTNTYIRQNPCFWNDQFLVVRAINQTGEGAGLNVTGIPGRRGSYILHSLRH